VYSDPLTFGLPPNLVNSRQPERTHMRYELTSRGGDMLSKEYLDTARTLRRVVRDMTNPTIADRLQALVEDYERRAEKASQADAANTLARPAARGEREGGAPK
jgi:predicted ArsR family transcriptional regulator